eukprot:gene13220-27967_t
MLNYCSENLADSSFHELGCFVRSNPSHVVKLIDNGVCEMVIRRLRVDGQKSHVAYYGCFALHSLALYPAARARLSKPGPCWVIMEVFRSHTRNVRALQNASWLLRNICCEPEARESLISIRAHLTIVDTAYECFLNDILPEVSQIFAPLMSLAAHADVRRDLLESDKAISLIVKCLCCHKSLSSEQIIDLFGMLHNLCYCDPRARDVVTATAIVSLAVEVVSARTADRTLVTAGFQALSSISGKNAISAGEYAGN